MLIHFLVQCSFLAYCKRISNSSLFTQILGALTGLENEGLLTIINLKQPIQSIIAQRNKDLLWIAKTKSENRFVIQIFLLCECIHSFYNYIFLYDFHFSEYFGGGND